MSFRRRFLVTLVPEEFRLLEAATAVWSRRLVWPEPEVRDTVTFVGGGLGDSRSLWGHVGRHLSYSTGGGTDRFWERGILDFILTETVAKSEVLGR